MCVLRHICPRWYAYALAQPESVITAQHTHSKETQTTTDRQTDRPLHTDHPPQPTTLPTLEQSKPDIHTHTNSITNIYMMIIPHAHTWI